MKTRFKISRKDTIKATIQNLDSGKLLASIKDKDFNSVTNVITTLKTRLNCNDCKVLINITNETKQTFKSIETNYKK